MKKKRLCYWIGDVLSLWMRHICKLANRGIKKRHLQTDNRFQFAFIITKCTCLEPFRGLLTNCYEMRRYNKKLK